MDAGNAHKVMIIPHMDPEYTRIVSKLNPIKLESCLK